MNEIGYKLLVDKSVRRKVDILVVLSKRSSTVNQLSEICEVSRKTLYYTLQELKVELPDSILLIQKKNDVVELEISNYFLLTSYINEMMTLNPLYQVIDSLFSGKKNSIDSYSDELFISNTTLRYYLKFLKKVLLDYRLELKMAPVEIIGNEVDIRYFYFQYIRYVHNDFSENIPEGLMEAIENTVTDHGVSLNVDFNRMLNWMIVTEKRVSQGYAVQLNEDTIKRHIETSSYMKFKPIFTYNMRGIPILNTLTEDELLTCYITRLDSIIYENHSVYFMKDYASNLFKFEKIVEEFFLRNQLHPALNYELKYSIQAFLSNLDILSDVTDLHQKCSIKIKEAASFRHNPIFSTWYELLQEFTDFRRIEDVAASLTLLSVAHLRLNESKSKQILIALSGEPGTLNYYRTIATQIFPKESILHFIFNKPIDNALLESLSIEVCIHNYPLPIQLEKVTLIRLSDIPDDDEWAWLVSTLYQI